MKKAFLAFFLVYSMHSLTSIAQKKQENSIPLFGGFQNPPNMARPRVWWHWMNGNITQSGIRKDLLWMHQSGIGGFHNFDAGLATPLIAPQRLSYMSTEWKKAFLYTTKLADSLNLEMAIAASPGWSQNGGPWVAIEDGMKKLTWRSIYINGSQLVKLPQPFFTSGTFQNIPIKEDVTAFTTDTTTPPQLYRDIAVLAYKLPDGDRPIEALQPKVTSSGGKFTLEKLTNGDLADYTFLPADASKGYSWIQFEFSQAQTIKSISIAGTRVREQWGLMPADDERRLEVSNDGVHFKLVSKLLLGGVAQQTIAFTPTQGKYFRVIFNNPNVSYYEEKSGKKGDLGTHISEIILHTATRINHSEEKSGFASPFDLEQFPTPKTAEPLLLSSVIDLTKKLNSDGTLNWNPPAGTWKVIRFGYSLTGKKNHPASPEATGLEVDKLDARAVQAYYETYLNKYQEATGGLMGKKGLQYIITDSYEAGQMTWTPEMANEFQKRRGYALLPWMPVLTGQVIQSTEASEQFLWDWRKTIAELIAENNYDNLTSILASKEMGRYTESHENGRLYLVDGMDAKRTATIPMSAMWEPSGWGSDTPMAKADIKESASVAHIYGQNLVAAESLTAYGLEGHAWSYYPENLKPTADLELAMGLNRFVIHTSVHQPSDDKIPGLGLYVFGQWFNRHETWAKQAKAWTDYLARSSYMLQQGQYVADVLYYYGEDNNITGLFGKKLPQVPAGYSFDFINAHALIHLLEVKNGQLVTPSGMTYKVLYLDENVKRMSMPVLRKLAYLVKQGAIIGGAKPVFKAELMGSQKEFDSLVSEIWNTKVTKEGITIDQLLQQNDVKPDFTFIKNQEDTQVLYVHRRLSTGDIYWINNRKNRFETIEATFRVTGLKPELWHPETGQKEDVSYKIVNGQTVVSLPLTPNDAVFVVFEEPTLQNTYQVSHKELLGTLKLDGPWEVTFQENRGAPEKSILPSLGSWTENIDDGIKYFSGTATYRKTFEIKDSLSANSSISLDLGVVKNIAEVSLNGQTLGILWKSPFRTDIGSILKLGTNYLEIKVTNLWVNRLIGDAQPNVKNKITYTTIPFYQADSQLLEAGLLGPVSIILTK